MIVINLMRSKGKNEPKFPSGTLVDHVLGGVKPLGFFFPDDDRVEIKYLLSKWPSDLCNIG